VSVVSHWSLDPARLLVVALAAFLYWRRALTLRQRGAAVPGWRQGLFALGLVVFLVAVVSPVDWIGEERLFSMHMLQHVLLGDLAPLCIVAGLTGPLLRPILQFGAIERLRFLAHPLVALPLWAINLFVWHLPAAYEAALGSDGVHALQHLCFFTFGALMWAPIVEVLPGPMWFGTGWKLGYIVVVRLLETVLGNVYLWTGSVVYSTYEHTPRLWGLSPLADQELAGATMASEQAIVLFAVFAFWFRRFLAEEGAT
jgi:cytochrome c oxidase assembly factor CtaG